jgi:hypothetical protein
MRRPRTAVALGLLVLVVARVGRADGDVTAQAEELFQEGRRAFEAHDYATATEKLAASLKLEPAVGTTISLAECDEATGHLAGARQRWQEAAELADAKHDPLRRGAFAWQRFSAIDARLPRLLLRPKAGAPSDTVYRRDDQPKASAAFDVELPVDPGVHLITVTAAGYEARSYRIDLVERERRVLEVEPGAETPAPTPSPAQAPPAPAAPALVTPTSRLPPQPAGEDVKANGSQRWARASLPVATRVGIAVLVGAGVADFGAGAYFGMRAFDEKSMRDKACSGGSCSAAALPHDADAESSALLSTAAFAGGFALVATGCTWFLVDSWLAGRTERASPPRSAGALVLGALGVVGLVTGSYFGLRTMSDKGARDAACRAAPSGCPPMALRDDADARASATLSTGMLAASLVALASGLALGITGRSHASNAGPQLRPVPMLTGRAAAILVEGQLE